MSFPRYPKYKPSGVGRVGYEIPFNRHFNVFHPPLPWPHSRGAVFPVSPPAASLPEGNRTLYEYDKH